MKFIPIISVLVLLLGAGCQKESPRYNAYSGRWELRTDITILGQNNYSPGNGWLLVFDNRTFKMLHAGSIIHQGDYTLEKANYPFYGLNRKLDKMTSQGLTFYLEIVKDTLIVYPDTEVADGGPSAYVRTGN